MLAIENDATLNALAVEAFNDLLKSTASGKASKIHCSTNFRDKSKMGGDGGIYIFGFLMTAIVMIRLNRLGKQIEAVDVSIRADIARTDPERDAIINEWKQEKDAAAKAERQFLMFWGIVLAAAAIAWAFFKQH
jgi:hypothetical protein